MYLATQSFGAGATAGGWASFDRFPRRLGDVNGDDIADIVGFGENGTYVTFGTAAGTFGPLTLATGDFGAGAAAGGWASFNRYPRQLGDLNGDGRSDIVGFGDNGTYVALANASG